MGRMGVQRDEVFTACDELIRKGIPVTVANVRQELGTGSYSTLLPLIGEFQTAKKAEPFPRPIPSIPSEISEASTRFIAELWEMAAKFADSRVREFEEKAKAREEELLAELKGKTEELTQAHTDIQGLESSLEEAKSAIEAAKAEHATTIKRAEQAETEREMLSAQLKERDENLKRALERAAVAEKGLEARGREITEMEKRIEAIKTQTKDQAEKIQAQTKALSQSEARLELLEKQLAAKDNEIRQLLERSARAEKEADLLRKERK